MMSFVSVMDYGAVGDGVTNDTAAFANALASLGLSGGTVMVPQGRKFLIDSNLTIPASCHLVGPHKFVGTPGSPAYAPLGPYGNVSGALIINPAATITVSSGASVSGCLVYRKGMIFPDILSNFAGTAFTIGGDDAAIANSMILGFNKAIYSSGGVRPRFEYIWHDNNNGIEITNCIDVPYISNCHAWPFASVPNGNPYRTGIAYYLHDTVDWAKVTNCFAYGYYRGFYASSVNDACFIGCSVDSSPTQSGSIGVAVDGSSLRTRIIGGNISSQDTGIYIAVTPGIYAETMVTGGTHVTTCSSCCILVHSGDVQIGGNSVISNTTYGISVDNGTSRVMANDIRFSNINQPFYLPALTRTVFVGENIDYGNSANGSYVVGNNLVAQSLASAEPLLLPPTGKVFNITSSANTSIATIAGGYVGRTIKLILPGSLTLVNGTSNPGNMRLNNSVNFTTASGSSIVLTHNGTQWFEDGRSV